MPSCWLIQAVAPYHARPPNAGDHRRHLERADADVERQLRIIVQTLPREGLGHSRQTGPAHNSPPGAPHAKPMRWSPRLQEGFLDQQCHRRPVVVIHPESSRVNGSCWIICRQENRGLSRSMDGPSNFSINTTPATAFSASIGGHDADSLLSRAESADVGHVN